MRRFISNLLAVSILVLTFGSVSFAAEKQLYVDGSTLQETADYYYSKDESSTLKQAYPDYNHVSVLDGNRITRIVTYTDACNNPNITVIYYDYDIENKTRTVTYNNQWYFMRYDAATVTMHPELQDVTSVNTYKITVEYK